MKRVHDTTYDLIIDNEFWRLTMFHEWEAFQKVSHLAGIVWQDADATRHRLLQEPWCVELQTAALPRLHPYIPLEDCEEEATHGHDTPDSR